MTFSCGRRGLCLPFGRLTWRWFASDNRCNRRQKALQGLVGQNGIEVPQNSCSVGAAKDLLESFVSTASDVSANEFFLAVAWIGMSL
jgi:hypothetical protein